MKPRRRIVAEPDALQAEVDALKRLQAETAAELDARLPSILTKPLKELRAFFKSRPSSMIVRWRFLPNLNQNTGVNIC